MKINIQKLQAGGGIPVYKPLPMLPQTPIAPEGAESPLKDDLLEKAIGKGITSDVMVYAGQVKSAYQNYSMLSDAMKNSPEGQMLRQEMKGNWAKLNALERSKETFDGIIKDREKALPETAIYQGKVIARDLQTGELTPLAIPDYAAQLKGENGPKYKALTNSELAYLRENDNRYAGKNEIFNILQNAVSTDEVTKEIRGVLQDLGSFAKGTADVSYEEKQIGDGASGLLSKGAGYIRTSEGEFKQSNRENIKMASNAMWANLKDNSKDLLRAKAAALGIPPDKIEQAAMGLAISLLDPATKEYIKTTDSNLPGKGGIGKAITPGEGGVYQQLATENTPKKQIQLNLGSSKSAIMQGWEIPNFEKKNGELRGPEFLSNIPELNYITDTSNGVYIGDQRVKPENYDALLWNGKAGYKVYMPVKADPKNEGQMMPDVDGAERLNQAKKDIATHKGKIDLNTKKQIYYSQGFEDLDENGDPVIGRTVFPFLTFIGSINESLIDSPNSSSLHQNTSDEDAFYENRYTVDDKGKKVSRPGHQWYWPNATSVKSTVFIPMKVGAAYEATLLEQGHVKIPGEQMYGSFYDTTLPYGKQGKLGVKQIDKSSASADSLNK